MLNIVLTSYFHDNIVDSKPCVNDFEFSVKTVNMKQSLPSGSFLLCLILALTLFLVPQPATSTDIQPNSELGTIPTLSLIGIYTWTNSLPRDLIDLQNDVDTLASLNRLEKQLPDVSKQIEDMEWESTTLMSNPNLIYHELSSFKVKLIKVKLKLDSINDPIKSNVQHLEAWYKGWLTKESELQKIRQQAQNDTRLKNSLPDIESLSTMIVNARELIEKHLRTNLLGGQKIEQIQTRVYVLNGAVVDLTRDLNEAGIQQTYPPMFSSKFYNHINKQLFEEGWQNIRFFAKYQWSYFRQYLGSTIFGLFFVLTVALCIYLSRPLTKVSSKWHSFTARPLVTAVFIFSTGFNLVNSLAININLPPGWGTLIQFSLVFSVTLLIKLICKTAWKITLLRQFLFFLMISQVLNLASLPGILFYLFIFCFSVVLLCFYLILFINRWFTTSEKKVTWAFLLWGIFPLVIIIASISGFDQLAVIIFGRTLSLVAATLTIWLMVYLFAGLLELSLQYIPIKIFRRNATTIVKQVTPLLVLIHGLFWLVVALYILWFYPTLNAAFSTVTSLQFNFFSLTITPGSILTVILIVYTTLLFSRGLSAFLRQEVLPHYKVEEGVQISITRLVHYAVLFVGLIILLWVLGFSLNQVTIIGGALGVGIGFGLQAIVNNFVSGLILLFERPLKIGDMIEVGDDVGEVKKLGLRATTVQTFDNAEIVIPNSELITGSVINWTLAEKKARVKIPVGVAYGTDISQVMKILLSCAEANATVLSSPKPQALFLAFGSSSLDFELRAWIGDFAERQMVLSELNQDIESEFQLAGVEIPFPQTDLHLRSVDKETTAHLVQMTTQPDLKI